MDRLFGDHKVPQVMCLGGGFDHLDVEEFIDVFREQEWRHLEQVVLVLTTEDEPSIVVRPPGQRRPSPRKGIINPAKLRRRDDKLRGLASRWTSVP